MINPFNITKAVDYTDFDIEKFWVDFGETGFKEFLKPNSPKPMLIIGSKGSGKTHMLKYFSYDLQKIRFKDNYENILKNDKYLGVFMRCKGLNSERFKGDFLTDDKWNLLFGYYLDLWFAQKLIRILNDFNIDEKLQGDICKKIILLFDKYSREIPKDFNQLLEDLIILQKELDYNINNIGFIDEPKIEILATLGSLIFGIPQIIQNSLPVFKDVNFLYIIDELENISEEKQKIINSLYREKELPVTFRISGRPYAFKTFETLGSGEENVVQSEYEVAFLDDFFRQDPDKYNEFIIKMSLKKLHQNGYNISEEEFFNYFEEFNIDNFYEKCRSKPDKYLNLHIKRLEASLLKIKLEKETIELITSNLVCPSNLLVEKAKFLLFYRYWKKNNGKKLIEGSSEILLMGDQYIENKSVVKNDITTIIKYFKDDLLDQVAIDSKELFPSYTGIENFIKLSSGIPRTFLNLMKNSFDNAYFENGKIPFKECIISIKAQEKSVKEASEWFFDENRIPFKQNSSNSPKIILNRLCNFLRELRSSNIPPECSINLFSIDVELLTSEYLDIFKTLEEYSYLIKSQNRITKNSREKNETFFINGTIASYYELAISKRGVFEISKNILEAIFEEDKHQILKDKIKTYNAPFENELRNQTKLSI